MGVSSHPFLVCSLSLKDLLQGNIDENKNSSYGCLWSKVLAAQAKKQKVSKKSTVLKSRRRTERMLMRRRARLTEGSRKRGNGVERRIRTLKRLIPYSESTGLDGLFRETAGYILSLQRKVRVMQIMVKILTGSDE